MKKNVTSKQHYVPKYYLKQFSYQAKKSGKNKKYLIHVYDLKQHSKFTNTIDNVGMGFDFYEAPENPEMKINNELIIKQNEVEDFLHKLESMVAPYLHKVVNVLTTDQLFLLQFLGQQETRLNIGLHYLMQFYRTQKWRRSVEDFEKKNLKQELIYNEFHHGWNEERYWKNLKVLKDFSLQKATWKQIITLLDLEELNKELNQIGNYIWTIAENKNETPLISSDSPIIHFDYFLTDNIKYGCSALPLNPNYILILYHAYPTDPNLGYLNNAILSLSDKEVMKFNCFQKEQCLRMLFSNKEIIDKFFN